MTAFLSFEAVEGKLIADPNGGQVGQPAYCGYLDFIQGDWEGAPRMRVPLLAFAEEPGDVPRYRLDLGGIEGSMELQKNKYKPFCADFEGTIGHEKRLEIAAWRQFNAKEGWHMRLRAWGFLFSNGEWTRSTEAAVF